MSTRLVANSGAIYGYRPGESYENRDEYELVCSWFKLGSYIAYFHGAHGEHSPSHLKNAVSDLKKSGVVLFLAIRCKGHKMPTPWRKFITIFDESLWYLRSCE